MAFHLIHTEYSKVQMLLKQRALGQPTIITKTKKKQKKKTKKKQKKKNQKKKKERKRKRFNRLMNDQNSVYQKRSIAKNIGDGRNHGVKAGKLRLT